MENMLNEFDRKNRITLTPIHWMSSLVGCNLGNRVKTRDGRKIITLTIAILSLVSLAAQFNFIWQNRHKSIVFYTDAICTWLQCVISLTKLLHMTLMQLQFYEILYDVQNSSVLRDMQLFKLDIPNKEKMIKDIQDILKASWNDIKRQLYVFYIIIFGISSWYFCFCLSINIYKSFIRPQPYEAIYPFAAQFPIWYKNDTHIPHYLIEYITVTSAWYLCSICGTIFASIFAVLSVHGIALVKVLCKLMSYACNDDYVPVQKRLVYIKACIVLQQRFYRYCDNLNKIYKIETVPFFILTIFIKCLIIFQASLAGPEHINFIFRGVLYFAATTFEVSMLCWNGQRLTTESSHLPSVIYDFAWYSKSSELKFLTQMMVMRSQHLINLTVGGFTTLSLVTLLAIMRTSASYFLLLKEVNDVN